MALIQIAIKALKWSILAEIASRAIGPASFLILTRILEPNDFGIVAAGTVIINFSQILSDAGLGKALIQRQDQVNECGDVVFWMNFFISIALAGILFIAAPLISEPFKDNRISLVLRVMCLLLPISALSSVHIAFFQKRLDFKPIFLFRLAAAAVPGFVCLLFALLHAGYWALVVGYLAGQVAQTAIIWQVSPWRPKWRFDSRLCLELWRFSRWILLEGLLGWFYAWADSLFVGIYLSTKELGVFQIGNMVVILIFTFLMSPIQPIIFSAFSQIRNESSIRTALLQIQKLEFLITLPVGIGLYILSSELELLLFNTAWEGIGLIVGILGLMHGLSWLMGSNSEAFKAINRPDVFVKIMLIGLIYYLPGYTIALSYGLNAFLWVRFSLFLISQVLHFYALSNVLRIRPSHVLQNIKSVLIKACLYVAIYFLVVSQIPLPGPPYATGLKIIVYAVIVAPFIYHTFYEHLAEYRTCNG